MMKQVIALGALGAVVCAGAFTFGNRAPEAPDFKLAAASGKTLSLTDFKGKYVILEWWNNGCPVVGKHYRSENIPKLQKEFIEKGAVWLTIVSSAPGKQGYVTTENAMTTMKGMGGQPTDILFDTTGETGKAYRATATPQIVLIGPKGEMLYNGAIDNNPRASGAAILQSENYLRRAWDEVHAGKPVSTPSTQAYGCAVKY
ncbi:MAG: redoxin domain-containing protein [Fimbriimonadaceae bacterium]|nr:redoxin domain-containing protein [Fimbriimonadaceae bacterium]